jgi:integrase
MRGSITQRSPGSWLIRYDAGKETVIDKKTGKLITRRKQKSLTVRGTKKQAQAKLNQILADLQRGEYVEPSARTFGEWLVEWLEILEASNTRSVRTIETYESDIRNHIRPKLGDIRLQALSPTDLQKYYNELNLANSTKERHHAIISGALKTAAAFGYVLRNVATMVPEKPKRNETERSAGAIKHCWSRDEAIQFLEALHDEPLQTQAFYTLALETGMRKGELCGLKWEDFDPATGTLTVTRNLVRGGRKPVFGPPKNKSPRTLGLDPATVRLLQKHKAKQNERKLANRNHYHDHGLIFAKDWEHMTRKNDVLGDPLGLSNIGERDFYPLIEKAKVRRIKFHGLRHTCATLALSDGMPPHLVANMLGHKDATETLRTYAHITPDTRQEAARRMATILRK